MCIRDSLFTHGHVVVRPVPLFSSVALHSTDGGHTLTGAAALDHLKQLRRLHVLKSTMAKKDSSASESMHSQAHTS
eukprot:7327345-Karenia_brevis.AAC.1